MRNSAKDRDRTTTHKSIRSTSDSDHGGHVELRKLLPSQIETVSPSIDHITHFIGNFQAMDGCEVNTEVDYVRRSQMPSFMAPKKIFPSKSP